MTLSEQFERLAARVAATFTRSPHRLVLAESCTCGLVANLLSLTPGASNWFCGSLVTYQNETKAEWLDIDLAILEDPAIGPVSPLVASQMAAAALRQTPHATIAASVTGHLGPDAPPRLDGTVFVVVLERGPLADGIRTRYFNQLRLPAELPGVAVSGGLRRYRQYLAADAVLRAIEQTLSS